MADSTTDIDSDVFSLKPLGASEVKVSRATTLFSPGIARTSVTSPSHSRPPKTTCLRWTTLNVAWSTSSSRPASSVLSRLPTVWRVFSFRDVPDRVGSLDWLPEPRLPEVQINEHPEQAHRLERLGSPEDERQRASHRPPGEEPARRLVGIGGELQHRLRQRGHWLVRQQIADECREHHLVVADEVTEPVVGIALGRTEREGHDELDRRPRL